MHTIPDTSLDLPGSLLCKARDVPGIVPIHFSAKFSRTGLALKPNPQRSIPATCSLRLNQGEFSRDRVAATA
jgi:hypothetical protein